MKFWQKLVPVLGVAGAVLLLGGMSECKLDTEKIVSAADLGIEVAAAVVEAKKNHPDSLRDRLEVYAERYCELRAAKGWAWEDVRAAAIEAGAPESVVTTVKSLVDRRCATGGG